VGSDGQQAINALLANALLPSRHPGRGAAQRVALAAAHGHGRPARACASVGRSSRYELLVHHDGVAANLRDVGVGVAQVLPVLAVAYCAPPGSTMLLEEPEIHLHPLAQAVLAEVFAEVSQQRQVQFLVETHSEHLFRRMQTLMARRQTSTAQCRMLFVERQGANAVLVPLEVDEFGAVRNWPPRFFGDAMGEAREQARARAQRGACAFPLLLRPPVAEPDSRGPLPASRLVDTNVLIVASAADAGSPFRAESTPMEEAALRQQVFDWLEAFEADPTRHAVLDVDWHVCGEYRHKLTEQDYGWLAMMHKMDRNEVVWVDVLLDKMATPCCRPSWPRP
jgi:hypothetical protein